ncbi:MAG: hypothetical protein HY721_06070 [Planctomycetes bacterium]|nr:hypothetical protein [Planctomycetota bacterium]
MRFRLEPAGSRSLGFILEFSEDGGRTFQRSSRASEAQASGDGSTLRLVWSAGAELSRPSQHDLVVRVTPYDRRSGKAGIAGESGTFGIGPNRPPRVLAVVPPGPRVGGVAAFEVDVIDEDLDSFRLEAELSLDGGRFRPATILEEGEVFDAPEDGPARVTVHWDAQGDAPGLVASAVRLRVRAADTEWGELAGAAFELSTVPPVVAALSIEGIEEAMNGSVPFTSLDEVEEPFQLAAPPHGFAFTVTIEPGSHGEEVEPGSLAVRLSRSLGKPGTPGWRPAGAELGPLFEQDAASGRARWRVPPESPIAEGPAAVTAEVSDVLGNRSEPASLDFLVVSPERHPGPFEEEDHWLLDFERDNFAIRGRLDSLGRLAVDAARGPNGVPDHVEDLALLGLQARGAEPDSSLEVLDRRVRETVEETVRGYLYAHYGREPDGSGGEEGSRIRFHLAPPPFSCSRLGIGGDDPLPGFTIGRAEYDERNSRRNDDGAEDLGVFSTNIVEYHVNSSLLFRRAFDPFVPGRGTPLGESPFDATVLGPSFDRSAPSNDPAANGRYDRIAAALDAWARMIALVAAHEIGHSVGLVAPRAPPRGLFGGERLASFAGPYTNAYHLDAPGNEIMAAALSFSDALLDGDAGPRFAALFKAYLLGRIRLR